MSEEEQKPEATPAPAGEPAGAEATSSEASAASDSAQETDAANAPPPKKRRKRRRGDAPLRGELDARGMQRPAFVLDFPADPELDALVRAFEAGNFAFVREQAPRLVESSSNADVKAAARELLRRIEPDPLVKFLLGVAVALFIVVVSYVYHSQGH